MVLYTMSKALYSNHSIKCPQSDYLYIHTKLLFFYVIYSGHTYSVQDSRGAPLFIHVFEIRMFLSGINSTFFLIPYNCNIRVFCFIFLYSSFLSLFLSFFFKRRESASRGKGQRERENLKQMWESNS